MNTKGFTLIEIMITLVIIGILLSVALPRFQRKNPSDERRAFFAQLNALLALGWQNAIITKTVHRVHFLMSKKIVILEEQAEGVDAYGEQQFKPVRRAYIPTQLKWPSNLEFREFIIEGTDEMKAHGTRKTGELWFYIMPSGIAQNVSIMLVDTQDRAVNKKARHVQLLLNPFNVQVSAYENAA